MVPLQPWEEIFTLECIFDRRLPSEDLESKFLPVGCDKAVYQNSLSVLIVKDQNISWCQNKVTKDEQGQLRWRRRQRRRRTLDMRIDTCCLTKHTSNLTCRDRASIWFFGMWVERREKWRRNVSWGWRKKNNLKTAEGSANLVKMAENSHKLVKCPSPSGELAGVLFPKPESVRTYFEETKIDACPVYQVCQSW